MPQDTIYHLVPRSEFEADCVAEEYKPARFEADGFMHCTGDLTTLVAVANDYFAFLDEPLLVLRIAVSKLTALVRFESPAPIAGQGATHLERANLFPHIYGPLNLDAVTGAAFLDRDPDGRYGAPDGFVPLVHCRRPAFGDNP